MIASVMNRLKGTDWELLTDFISPVFFDVVPTLGMLRVFGRIVKDSTDRTEFRRVRESTHGVLRSKVNPTQEVELQLVETLSANTNLSLLTVDQRRQYGEMVLKIYFAQIFSNGTTILDLRSTAFQFPSEWAPKPVFFAWDDDFRAGLRDLYCGYYTSDDVRLKSGLKSLQLMHAESILRSHFGEGEQNSVRFSLAHFKKSIHAVFVSCKENKARLHPDFFALGVYLLCLYENLESLNCPLDVKKAFQEAVNL